MRVLLCSYIVFALAACSSNPMLSSDGVGKAVSSGTSLTPDPSGMVFTVGDGWTTFTVNTDLDSVLVVANPGGDYDNALEIEGGNNPPSRAYCPAEGSDRPKKARKDGYKIHVKPCDSGETAIVLKDYESGQTLAEYKVYVVQEGESVDVGFNIDLHYATGIPSIAKKAIQDAAMRWQEVIVGDLPEMCASYDHLTADFLTTGAEIDDFAIVVAKRGKYNEETWISFNHTQYRDERRVLVLVIFLPFQPGEGVKWGEEEWLYDWVYRESLLAMGWSFGLVPADVYEGEYGFFNGKNALEIWKKRAPSGHADSIPVLWGWGDDYIRTNSLFSSHPLDWETATITELDAAALQDLGYEVDMSAVDDLVVAVGYSGKIVAKE